MKYPKATIAIRGPSHHEPLDATYGQLADRMREAAYQKVDEYGLVQDVCGSPHFDRPGTATEGQAFFLLMEAAARDLCVKNQGTDNERR